jgi:uncharacterized spore protein YtfJ
MDFMYAIIKKLQHTVLFTVKTWEVVTDGSLEISLIGMGTGGQCGMGRTQGSVGIGLHHGGGASGVHIVAASIASTKDTIQLLHVAQMHQTEKRQP